MVKIFEKEIEPFMRAGYKNAQTVEFVKEAVNNEEVQRLFRDLNDYLREGAEEAVQDIRHRKRMVHETIRVLMKIFW